MIIMDRTQAWTERLGGEVITAAKQISARRVKDCRCEMSTCSRFAKDESRSSLAANLSISTHGPDVPHVGKLVVLQTIFTIRTPRV